MTWDILQILHYTETRFNYFNENIGKVVDLSYIDANRKAFIITCTVDSVRIRHDLNEYGVVDGEPQIIQQYLQVTFKRI